MLTIFCVLLTSSFHLLLFFGRGFGGQREHSGPISQAGFLQLSFIGFGQRLKIGRARGDRVPRDSCKPQFCNYPGNSEEIQASLRPTGSA
jgi:hypothetical protein